MGVVVKRVGGADFGRFLKVMIGGDSGAGKTRFSSTFPDPLFLVTDPSLESVIDRAPAYAEIHSSDDMNDVLMKLRQPAAMQERVFGFVPKTVVIDTADDLQRIYIRERLAETKKDALTIPDYGWLGDQMRDITRNYRNLKMHVVVTVHLKDEKDEDSGKVAVKPSLVGAFDDQLSPMFALSLFIRTTQMPKVIDGASRKVEVKVVQTASDTQHQWVKDRFGVLPKPDYESDLTTDFERIYKAVFDRDLPAGTIIGDSSTSVDESVPDSGTDSSVGEAEKAAAARKKSTPKPAARAVDKRDEAKLPEAPPEPTPAPQAAAPEPTADPQPEPKPEPEVLDDAQTSAPELSQDAEPEPEPKPEEVRQETVPSDGTTAEVEPRYSMVCTSGGPQNAKGCGGGIENEDQRDLSWLRFRTTLCRSCFQAKKEEAAATKA